MPVFFRALTPRSLNVLAPILLLLAGTALFLGLDWPAIQEHRALDREIQAMAAGAQPEISLEEDRARLADEVSALNQALAVTAVTLPPVTAAFSFIEELGKLSRQEGVVLDQITPGNLMEASEFDAMPVELQVKGSFLRLARFLARVEGSTNLVRVKELSFTPGAEDAELELIAGLQIFCSPRPEDLR